MCRTRIDLHEIARKTITAFARLDEFEQAEWDALSAGKQVKLQQEARRREQSRTSAQIRAQVRTHGERAREHYSAMSPAAQDALGVTALLRVPAVGVQPRARARGAGRPKAHSTRSSARSGDSGEDGEPPGRTCGCGCGESIDHRASQARYLDDAHAAADRQRRRRARDRDWAPDVSPRDFIDQAEHERLVRRVTQGCRCNGHHIADPADGHCLKCGHDRDGAPELAGFIKAVSAETRRPRQAVQHAL